MGTYWQSSRCVRIRLPESTTFDWCIDSVHITDRTMEFNTTWKIPDGFPSGVRRGPDDGNLNMYVLDDAGRRFDHTATRGAASFGGFIGRSNPAMTGAFVFPLPSSAASIFKFKDDDQGVMIENIVLNPHRRTDLQTSESILGAIRDTREIDILLEWTGLGVPAQEHFVLVRSASGFQGRKTSKRGHAAPPQEPQEQDVTLTLTLDAGESFFEALVSVPLLKTNYVPHITHTDDYPSIRVSLKTDGEAVTFSTESQGKGHVPWAVKVKGSTYVVPSASPAHAPMTSRRASTPFEERVYAVVRRIPVGETRSYLWVARRLGDRRLARAVGQALHRNPCLRGTCHCAARRLSTVAGRRQAGGRQADPLHTPCHRVIRSDGTLGGYARGSSAKRARLGQEARPCRH